MSENRAPKAQGKPMPNSPTPLLERIAANPVLIAPDSAPMLESTFQHIAASEKMTEALDHPSANSRLSHDDFWNPEDKWLLRFRPYNVQDGVLQIPVQGFLVSKFPFALGRWMTGYTYIERAMQRGLEDDNVKAIAFVVDSFGGEAAGNFELTDKIYDARSGKPLRAFVADYGYSAAYAIASAAEEVTVTRSGGVGSIGVVNVHVEFSEQLKDRGVKVTYTFAGKHKVDGNQTEPLSAQAQEYIRSRVDGLYDEFTSTVARNRDMEVEDVRATEAASYRAQEGVDAGLADRVGALDDEMVLLIEHVAEMGDDQMAGKNGGSEESNTVTQEAHDQAVSAARSEGLNAGIEQERTRVQGIVSCENAKERPHAAHNCAMNTSMSVEEANKFLAGMPEENASSGSDSQENTSNSAPNNTQNGFNSAMNNSQNPDVGAGQEPENGQDEELSSQDKIARIKGNYLGASPSKNQAA